MSERDRQRHELGRLVAREAEHHPLVAGALAVGGYDKVWLLAGVSVMRSTRRPRLSRDRASRVHALPVTGRFWWGQEQ